MNSCINVGTFNVSVNSKYSHPPPPPHTHTPIPAHTPGIWLQVSSVQSGIKTQNFALQAGNLSIQEALVSSLMHYRDKCLCHSPQSSLFLLRYPFGFLGKHLREFLSEEFLMGVQWDVTRNFMQIMYRKSASFTERSTQQGFSSFCCNLYFCLLNPKRIGNLILCEVKPLLEGHLTV